MALAFKRQPFVLPRGIDVLRSKPIGETFAWSAI